MTDFNMILLENFIHRRLGMLKLESLVNKQHPKQKGLVYRTNGLYTKANTSNIMIPDKKNMTILFIASFLECTVT